MSARLDASLDRLSANVDRRIDEAESKITARIDALIAFVHDHADRECADADRVVTEDDGDPS